MLLERLIGLSILGVDLNPCAMERLIYGGCKTMCYKCRVVKIKEMKEEIKSYE